MTPSRYCLGCRYPLDFLPGNRCPECGRPFDPADPATYTTSPNKPWIATATRAEKWLVMIAAVVAVYFLVEAGLDWGSSLHTCRICGASSTDRHLKFFGLGGNYGVVITEGPVSQFIQRHDGHPCLHSWEFASRTGRGLFARYVTDGRGGSRVAWVRWLDVSSPAITQFLDGKLQAYPGFLRDLKTAIRGDDFTKSHKYFNKLHDEAADWLTSRPTSVCTSTCPASQP